MISNWYDIHSHTLPGVDDGAVDFEMAEKMLRLASSDGTRHIIMTPHYCSGKFECDTAFIQSQFENLCHMTKQILPDMNLYLGQELYYSNDLTDLLWDGKIKTLADSSYILIEFSYERDYLFIQWALEELRSAGYKVILAHFERYSCLQNNIERLRELVDSGVYLQITAAYAREMTGKVFSNYIKKAFQEHLIHFVGTDSHNTTSRPPLMRKCISVLCKKYGMQYVREMLISNPEKIIQNKFI